MVRLWDELGGVRVYVTKREVEKWRGQELKREGKVLAWVGGVEYALARQVPVKVMRKWEREGSVSGVRAEVAGVWMSRVHTYAGRGIGLGLR